MKTKITGTVILLGLLVSTGCAQSGQIGFVCSSADGWILAFQDVVYHTIWVADRDTVRPVAKGIGDGLALSPDGRYVFVITHSDPERNFSGFGDQFELLDLTTGDRWGGIGPWPTDVGRWHARLLFEPDGSFILWIDPEAYSKVTEDGPATLPVDLGWRYAVGEGFEIIEQLPSGGRPLGWSTNGFDSQRAAIVPIGYDGWNAARQIWVRPDGSTMEIARQNDLPFMVPRAIVLAPLAVVNPFVLSDVVYVVQSFGSVWEPGEQQAKIDDLVEARTRVGQR